MWWHDCSAWPKSALGQWPCHFGLVEVLPECGLLSTIVQPSLNWLYHCLICVIPLESSLNAWLNLLSGFHLGITKLLAKFDAILLLRLFHHFVATENLTDIHNTHSQADHQQLMYLQAGKNSCMCTNVPYALSATGTSCVWFISTEKKKIKVGYFWTDLVLGNQICILGLFISLSIKK